MAEKLYKMVDGERVQMTNEEAAIVRAEWAKNEARMEVTQYKKLRQETYPAINEQLDMLYHDKINGTNEWVTCIMAIKNKYPKPIGE